VQIDEAAGLLRQLLAQDVERTTEGQAVLKEGVAKDRVPSVGIVPELSVAMRPEFG
jgi:hypothetical protein